MHYHCEIIMPPIDPLFSIEKVHEHVTQVMAPFDENLEDNQHSFWDWWVIGGRWSGEHQTSQYSKERLSDFYAELKKMGTTVSGLKFGKDELQPTSQTAAVDELWRKFFPEYEGEHCPLFKHAGDSLSGDVCRLGDVSDKLTAARVIISAVDGTANYMVSADIWNGVIFQDTTWDGNVWRAVEDFRKHSKRYRREWLDRNLPKENWLAVTVDYHS